jgi:ankyrin repeat protein
MYAVFPSFDGRLMGGFLGSLCGEQFPGSVGLVQLLAKHGAELNARDALGRTALMMAALSAQPKLVEELLILGADPAIRDGDGRTALELTPDVYQARIADGAPNPTVAVAREIKTILRFYQEEPEFRATLGAATPVPLPVSRIIGDYLFGGRGPAQAAVEEPKQALPREERKDAAPLEERKAPAVDAKALDQALAAAVQRLEVKEAAALLAQGADVNVRLGAGRTPLILAAMEGHASLARLLLKQDGVEFDHQDSGGRSALMHAALADKPELVIQLLDKGADINLLDGDQQTAYDLAFGRPTILHLIEERQNRKVGEEVD